MFSFYFFFIWKYEHDINNKIHLRVIARPRPIARRNIFVLCIIFFFFFSFWIVSKSVVKAEQSVYTIICKNFFGESFQNNFYSSAQVLYTRALRERYIRILKEKDFNIMLSRYTRFFVYICKLKIGHRKCNENTLPFLVMHPDLLLILMTQNSTNLHFPVLYLYWHAMHGIHYDTGIYY